MSRIVGYCSRDIGPSLELDDDAVTVLGPGARLP